MTYEKIIRRMLSRVPNKFDKREGSVIYDALAPAAVEIAQMYIELNDCMNEAFADTASREFLIRRAAERGVSPYPATNAILEAQFVPADIDVSGQRFSLDDMNYTVISKVEDGIYEIQAETAGVKGNRYFGSLIPIDYIQGLQTASVTALLIPGEDEENTESFRARYLESLVSMSFGGNRKDYVDKTNAIEGVGDTKVTPCWNGGGTVKLTIVDGDFNRASDSLIEKVQNIIDPYGDESGSGLAPIGHVVTVDTVSEIDVYISANLVFDDGYSWDSVREKAGSVVSDYLLELRKNWAGQSRLVVRAAQIETGLFGIEGVLDISDTKINGLKQNLTLGAFEIPVFGGVELDS